MATLLKAKQSAEEKWNSHADIDNQWDNLGMDEKVELIATELGVEDGVQYGNDGSQRRAKRN